MYADDLLLLSISTCDMQNMINICKTELDWLDMHINLDKTKCIRIGRRHNCKTTDISSSAHFVAATRVLD